MSKFKPEVGDVWGSKFATYHIVEVNPIAAFCIVDDVYVRCDNVYITYITEHLKYLGKAKAKMGDLFDVDKTNPCQNCNMTDEYCASECEK